MMSLKVSGTYSQDEVQEDVDVTIIYNPSMSFNEKAYLSRSLHSQTMNKLSNTRHEESLNESLCGSEEVVRDKFSQEFDEVKQRSSFSVWERLSSNDDSLIEHNSRETLLMRSDRNK